MFTRRSKKSRKNFYDWNNDTRAQRTAEHLDRYPLADPPPPDPPDLNPAPNPYNPDHR